MALIDADPLGSGLGLLLGGDHAGGARWGDLVERQGRMSWPALRETLPEISGVALITWEHGPAQPVPTAAMRAVLASAARGTDLVVVDLSRGLDTGAEEALRRTTVALLTVPADVHAVMSAARIAPRLSDRVADLRVVVRGASPALPAETVARALGLPLSGDIAPDPGLNRILERGDIPATRPKSPLRRFASDFVADICAAPDGMEADR
ncbi:septum site-determining protein Ssd [Allosalinactinospora lopnorensis]|uniref:septum site-determining protein Ssd n=1 Tax=Allosalinactinospora lopnorensis TaxID=1352348 RepID=UPI0030844729